MRNSLFNKVLVGDCFRVLPELLPDSVDLCVTSPPFWGLRCYDETMKIWDGNLDCEHEWMDTPPPRSRKEKDVKNLESKQATVRGSNYEQIKGGFCFKCEAWKGQLGMEPHPQMFIDHLVEFGRLVRRVLKPSGLFWLNLGDTYFGGKGKSANKWSENHFDRETIQKEKWKLGRDKPQDICEQDDMWLQPKQLLMIPSRVACALQDDGWILRSDVIWFKPNHMPESVGDRFTKAYEHFFMFSKQKRYYFNLDAIRVPFSPNVTRWGGNIMKVPPNEKIKQGTAKALTKNDRPWRSGEDKNPGDVWEIPTQPFPGSHFAVFPEALVERIIKCGCPPKGIVLDPFAGSGTALRVARRLGRSFIGIELNPEYAEMAEQRIRGRNFREKNIGIKPLETSG